MSVSLRRPKHHDQQGASLMLILFILSVAVVLGVSLSMISGTSNLSSAYAYRGAQAYFAARAGLDYALARIVSGVGCAGIAPAFTIDGHTVTISCSARGPFDEDTPAYTIYNITATASRGGFNAPDASTRQLRASIKNP